MNQGPAQNKTHQLRLKQHQNASALDNLAQRRKNSRKLAESGDVAEEDAILGSAEQPSQESKRMSLRDLKSGRSDESSESVDEDVTQRHSKSIAPSKGSGGSTGASLAAAALKGRK